MNMYGNNSTNNYSGNTSNSFSNYGASPGFGLNIAQQSQYGHRASAPDTLELSRSHDLHQDVNQIPIEQFLKPIQHQPWNSHGFRTGFYSSRLQQPSWPNDALQPGRSAMTEPAPNQDQDMFMQRSNSHRGPETETEDSGYQSQLSSSGGHFSDPYSFNKKELEQDFLPGSGNRLDSNHVDERRPHPPRSVVSDHVISGRVSRKLPVIKCPDCGRQAKNASDAKKHAFTHEKPYKCAERGCSRKEGFATVNDRERHRKSVHHVRPTVGNSSGYICAACVQNGSKENKFWPRRDNFKAHIKRKHKDENEAQLLEMSKAQRPDDAISMYGDHSIYIAQSRDVSQMDRTEGTGYQNNLANESSPTMSRHASQQEDVGTLFDSAVEMPEASFMGMGSHVDGMNPQHEQYDAHFMGSSTAAGLEALGQAASIQNHASNYLHPSSAQQPTKRRRVDSTSSYTGGFGNDQQSNNISFTIPSPTSKLETPTQGMRTPASNSPPHEHKCPECNKIKKRECDLKKHMKRHTRPYGCTFASCAKKFGSRNDWKRHENGQHFLSEMWKCGRSRILDGGSCCRRPFHTLDQMQRHLRGPEHQMSNPREIEEECKKFHLGREGHVHYWCGFCKALVRQPDYTTNAWENRFKHIGDHFDHDKKNIDDWVCIEENKAKKHISPQEEKAARRRAREGNRVEEEGELEEWTPDMNVEFANGGSFSGMKISSTVEKMGEDDPDADGESDGEAYTRMR